MSRLWVVCYDISDNRIRNKVCDLLKNHGERVQYSVFECHLGDRELAGLRQEVAGLLEQDDQVRWYPLCDWCKDKTSWDGPGMPPDDPYFRIV